MLLEPTVTWIRVEKPRFDLVGVVLSSLGMAGICAMIAFALGLVLGVGMILKQRRNPDAAPALELHLEPQ